MSEWEARLERIEIIAEVNTQQLQETSQIVRENSEAIREGRRQTQELKAAVASLVATAEQFQLNFERIMGEIRGIRIENQRILQHLFGSQAENGDR